jgi:hypothetical protein
MRNGDYVVHKGNHYRVGLYARLAEPVPVKGKAEPRIIGSGHLFDLGMDLGEVLELSDGTQEVKIHGRHLS